MDGLHRAARRGTLVGVLATLLLLLPVGCGDGVDEGAQVTPPRVAVDAFEVRGQEEGATFVGEAFARSLAAGLAQSDDIEVSVLTPPAPDAVRIGGVVTREGVGVRVRLRLIAPGAELPWEAELHSANSDTSMLASCLARQASEALEIGTPALYQYIGNMVCDPAAADSPLTTQAVAAWRDADLLAFRQLSGQLVERHPESLAGHALNAAAVAQVWDGAPTETLLAELRERLTALGRVDPQNPYADIFLAFIYRASGEPGWARTLYDRVLARRDLTIFARAWTLRQRSYVFLQLGEAEAARRDAQSAIDLDPAAAASYFALSRALERLGEYEAAIASSEQALDLEPRGWRFHQRLGIVLTRIERLDEALPYLETACQLSKRQEACANNAVTLVRAGRRREAARAAAEAETLASSSWGAYNLACYYALAGERQTALASLHRSIELGFADALIARDNDLDPLRAMPDFEGILSASNARLSSRRAMTKSVFPWQ